LIIGPTPVAGVERVAHDEARGHLGGGLREPVRDGRVHEEPLRRDAHLAAVAGLGDDRGLGDGVDVDVGEHQHRRVAAELERQALDRARGAVHQQLAHTRRAGERELAAARVVEERLTHAVGVAVDDVEHARRQARVVQELRVVERRARRELRRADDDGAAGGQGGGRGAVDVVDREVPGGDHAHHAERRVGHVDAAAVGAGGDPAPAELPRVLRGDPQVVRHAGPLGLRLRERLAGLLGGAPRHDVEAVAHELGRPLEHRGPVVHVARRPRGEGLGGGVEREAGVGRVPVRHARDHLLGPGVHEVPRAPAHGAHRLSADPHRVGPDLAHAASAGDGTLGDPR
jgi:hypothetical protein